MKKHYAYQSIFIIILMLSMSARTLAQGTPQPIPGRIYGQAIVACSSGSGEYVATTAAIYSRPANVNDYYARVWTAPDRLSIVSFAVESSGHRAILLKDGEGLFYMAYTQISAGGPDVTIVYPAPMPAPLVGAYTKVVAGAGIYAYSYLAGGPAGNLIVSRDSGQTWAPDTAGIGLDAVNDVAMDTANRVLIASQGSVYRQLPTDSVWTLTATVGNASKIFVDRHGRIITSSYGIDTKISVNDGATFNADNTGISYQVRYITDDAYGDLYAAAGGNIYRNPGGTGTWTNIGAAYNAATGSASLNCISGDSLLTFGTAKGVYTSTDHGATWTATNAGIYAQDIYSIVRQSDGSLVCTTELGLFHRSATDTLWQQSQLITPFYPGTNLSADPAGNVFVSVAYTFGAPYPLGRSTDDGASFSVDSNGFSAIGGSGFYIDENGDRHFYDYYSTTNSHAVWTAPMGSNTWSLDDTGIPLFPTSGLGVKDMCSDRRGHLYATVSTQSGVLLYRRPIAGGTWTLDTAGIGTSMIISPMASDPSIGLVAVVGNMCYRRAANGWVALSTTNLTTANSYINAISVDTHGYIYMALSHYSANDSDLVFYSPDSGTTWIGAGLMGRYVYQLYAHGDTTYAVTDHGGYFYTSGGANGISQPAANAGIIAFPNPSASGRWTLQAGEEWSGAQIEISDMSGRIVYTAIAERNSTAINAQQLASGIYVLQIRNANGSDSVRLVK